MLDEGIADCATIDLAMTKGLNFPRGLLQWAEDWGIETCAKGLDELFEIYHEERYRYSLLLRQMLEKKFF